MLERVRPGSLEHLALESAGGRVLAQPVHAATDLPSFAQSAMDGYALAASGEAPAGSRFRLAGVSRAGGVLPPPLRPGEATRVYTGAPVPEGATRVAIQEIVSVAGDVIELQKPVAPGLYVRPAGGDVAAGAEALAAGTPLGSAALALLRALGVEFVGVHRAPRVSLVASGDELCGDPAALQPGQVLESSSAGVREALRREGLALASLRMTRDTREAHLRALGAALEESEVLLVAGGVSVGDFDLVRPTLQELGVETVFWRVRQRPGGPLYFGAHGGKLVFGLPGNPASTLVCFHEYVLPALRRALGHAHPRLPRIPVRLEERVSKPPGKTHFARARLRAGAEGWRATLDPQQDSHTLRSFARAHGLVVLAAERERFERGETVPCDLLPGASPEVVA
ncbi:MAG: molybdopterin molybdotransferase MoeA [Candidatus Eisenbacteria bacterium]|nr:molybdopterin molybdotransferase MoeA [Candidatus Eisenbacteria bacterium]